MSRDRQRQAEIGRESQRWQRYADKFRDRQKKTERGRARQR